MPTPGSVKVGPQIYKVIYRSRKEDGMLNDNTYGYIIDSANTIVIDSQAPLNKQQSTLWHELFHATRMTYDTGARPANDLDFDDLEHHFIGVWEAPLLSVLKDNPELVLWLTKEDK